MKTTLAALAIALIASAAFADDGRWPGKTTNNPFEGWSTTHYDLSPQQTANRHHTFTLIRHLTESYGHPCFAPIQPVWIAERCGAKAFGYPMGSEGGSE